MTATIEAPPEKPKIKGKNVRSQKSVWLYRRELAAIELAAAREERSESQFIRLAVISKLKEIGIEPGNLKRQELDALGINTSFMDEDAPAS